MNLPAFLQNVDQMLSAMSEEQIRLFVHEKARMLEEGEREQFLDDLQRAAGRKGSSHEAKAEIDAVNSLHAEVASQCDILLALNEGNRKLDSEFNEEYDDWYNPDVDEVLIVDREKIIPDLEHACELVHQCVDAECFADAEKLLITLEWVDIPITGDYVDYNGESSISLQDLTETSSFDGDWRQAVIDGIYACYMNEPPEKRAEEIFALFCDCGDVDVSLEDIMQAGDQELPDFKRFLSDWQDYLKGQSGNQETLPRRSWSIKTSDFAKKLLQDAVRLNVDAASAVNSARKYGDVEPSLYLTAAQKCFEDEDPEQALRFAREALQTLKYQNGAENVRAAIAQIGIGPAEEMGRSDTAEQLRAEMFRAEPTPENYLELMLNVYSFDDRYHEEVNQIVSSGLNTSGKAYRDMGRPGMLTIAFLDGQFEPVLKKGLSVKEPLGWTGTFMKEGIALFLLGCYAGEADNLPPALQIMIHRSGIRNFELTYGAWRERREMSAPVKQKAMKKIESAISSRVSAILGKHRNYYGECADYIAAIGEVRESLGEAGMAKRMIESYYNQYSRYRAFREELRRYL